MKRARIYILSVLCTSWGLRKGIFSHRTRKGPPEVSPSPNNNRNLKTVLPESVIVLFFFRNRGSSSFLIPSSSFVRLLSRSTPFSTTMKFLRPLTSVHVNELFRIFFFPAVKIQRDDPAGPCTLARKLRREMDETR